MTTTATKTIAVIGATGAQGGAVVRAFHALGEDSGYEIRAITRNPESDKAKAIASTVKEVVKADAFDEESMAEAFKGCHGVFINSFFWDDLDVKHEMEMLRKCKDAAKRAGVKHIVLSSLEDTREFINQQEDKDTWKVLNEELGMYTPHFDGKGEVQADYDGLPVTILLTTFYYQNFIYFGMGPSRQAETDPYAITFPMADKKLCMVDVEDIGKCVCAIFQDESLIGKTIGVKSDALTGQEIADVFSKVCGQTVKYNAVPTEVFASFGFPGADDLANMFRFYAENETAFIKAREIPESVLSTMGGVTSLEDWLVANKSAFVLEPPKEE